MYFTLIQFGTPAYGESINLRDALLRKPLGLEFEPQDLATEYSSHHLCVYSDLDDLLGVLVLKPLSKDRIKMRQVAIRGDLQGQGIGSKLVMESENVASLHGFSTIELSARETAVQFYTRLDYTVVGDKYLEVGIEHFKMEKKLF